MPRPLWCGCWWCGSGWLVCPPSWCGLSLSVSGADWENIAPPYGRPMTIGDRIRYGASMGEVCHEQPYFWKTCQDHPPAPLARARKTFQQNVFFKRGRPLRKSFFQTRPQNLYNQAAQVESFNFIPISSKMVKVMMVYERPAN